MVVEPQSGATLGSFILVSFAHRSCPVCAHDVTRDFELVLKNNDGRIEFQGRNFGR